MPDRQVALSEALDLLKDRRSSVRRRGAVRLRELGTSDARGPLRTALRAELRDPRTWETQYEMVLALGRCGDAADDDWLKTVAQQPREQVMVNVAIGEALVRLHPGSEDAAIKWCLGTPVDLLAEGAERAVALMQLCPSKAVRELLMADADQRLSDGDHPNDTLGIWVVVAAAGWRDDEARSFLRKFRDDGREDVARAAASSLSGQYMELQQY